MDKLEVNEHILDDNKYDLIFSVEKVNELVLSGMPFRDAYKQVGLDVENGRFNHNKSIHHTHEGSIGNLCNDKISALKDKILSEFAFDKVKLAEKELLS